MSDEVQEWGVVREYREWGAGTETRWFADEAAALAEMQAKRPHGEPYMVVRTPAGPTRRVTDEGRDL